MYVSSFSAKINTLLILVCLQNWIRFLSNYFPGTTKAILPILDKMGIAALSIGVNGATTPAALPPVFMWNYRNTSLITLYHPGTQGLYW